MNDISEFRDDFGLSGEKRDAPRPHPLWAPERWGLFRDVDIASYHLGNIGDLDPETEIALSQSGMGKLLDETPLDFAYNHPQLNPDAREAALETAAMRRGDVVHQLALGKGAGFFVLPSAFADYKKQVAKDLRDEAIERGETPVLAAKYEEAEIMAEVIRDRIAEVLDGAEYETEVAFLYQEMTRAGPIWVRGMVDVWCPDQLMILDPKITPMIYDIKVERHLVNMGWDRQSALYSHAFGTILGAPALGRVRFRDLMIKPEAPYTTRLVALEKAWHWSAIKQCQEAMERFGACLYADEWPGFTEVHHAALPGWEDKRREKLETGEA